MHDYCYYRQCEKEIGQEAHSYFFDNYEFCNSFCEIKERGLFGFIFMRALMVGLWLGMLACAIGIIYGVFFLLCGIPEMLNGLQNASVKTWLAFIAFLLVIIIFKLDSKNKS